MFDEFDNNGWGNNYNNNGYGYNPYNSWNRGNGNNYLPQKALALNDTANSAIVNIFFILLLRMTIKQF
jgi:hypothetical protein